MCAVKQMSISRERYARKSDSGCQSFIDARGDALIRLLPTKFRLMGRLQYGAGLRVNELLRLRVKDLDFDRGQLVIRGQRG